jgi:CRISPR/Cas system Type II protein with McrA/HNH and RuvC-like nuclease domain
MCFTCKCDLSYTKRYNKYCSRSCSAKNTKNHTIHGKYTKLLKKCTICDEMTYNAKVCSEQCRRIILTGLRKYKTKEEKMHAKKMIQREAYARYAARKKYQTPVDEDLSAIKLFYKNCPDGYEVDHIIPVSKGGPHSLTNLQYLTISENRKKSNKIIEPPRRFELLYPDLGNLAPNPLAET